MKVTTEDRTGEKAANWKGGIIIRDGYTEIYRPEHPRANGNYVKLSVLVAERKIGRSLKKNEVPHHIDEDRSNDSDENIMVLTQTEHKSLHSSRSDVKLEDVKRLYEEEKLTPSQISERLNCSRATIYKRLRKLNVTLLPGSFKPDLKTEEMIRLKNQGKNFKEIGEILSCRGATVKARLRKAGVL